MHADLPILFFETSETWEDWLHRNGQSNGVWVKFAKKASGIPSLNYAQALEPALCYGWIDGQAKSIDDSYYMQKFTPRRPKSIWSKRNISIAERLIAEGKMRPAGQAAIDAAKADGRWSQAYDSPRNMVPPADFLEALEAHPKAKAFYATLNKTNTYAILWRIQTAKKPETRSARIEKLIAMLDKNEKLH